MTDRIKTISEIASIIKKVLEEEAQNINKEIMNIDNEETSEEVKKLKKEKLIEKQSWYNDTFQLIMEEILNETRRVKPDIVDVFVLLNSSLERLDKFIEEMNTNLKKITEHLVSTEGDKDADKDSN